MNIWKQNKKNYIYKYGKEFLVVYFKITIKDVYYKVNGCIKVPIERQW